MDRNWTDRIVGVVLGAMALTVYGVTLSAGAYPGESAGLVVQAAGLFPKLTPDHPLWSGLAWLIARLPVGSLAMRLNLLSALCGATSVFLLYHVVAGAIRWTITATPSSRTLMAARLGGVAASLFLMFCVPFWVVSNRAHPAALDILLLLTVAWLFYRFTIKGENRWLYALAFLYGVGVVEFATLIVFAPLIALGLVYVFLQKETFQPSVLVKATVCGLLGLSLYFIDAGLFYGSSGYELRGYTGYWQVVWIMWKDQAALIARSLPQSGWLIILMTTVVPWLACLAVARRGLNDEKDWTYYGLHAVITGLAISVLFNVKFAPWSMLQFGRLLVTPYLLTASVFGYLVAYWFLLPSGWWPDEDTAAKVWIRKWLGSMFAASLILSLLFMPFRNVTVTDGRPAELINRYAAEIVDNLSGRSWLLTDGALDSHLMVAAADRGLPLHVLNVRAGDNAVYMKYVAGLFQTPAMRNLAQIGMLPLVQQWLRSDTRVEKTVAILDVPDLWMGSGFSMVPNKLVFFGVKRVEDLNPASVFAEHEKFWNDQVPLLKSLSRGASPLELFDRYLLRHAGLVANDLGVLMEDFGCKYEAFHAYSKAREIDPDNVSALMNQSVMVNNGFATEQADLIKTNLDKAVANLRPESRLWSLARYYGYVRMPEAFAQMGWTWALSGQPGMAVSGLKKAMELLPDGRRTGIKQTLAGVYMLQGETEESEALYHELLMENPDNARALIGEARLAMTKGNIQEAKNLLARAEHAGVPKSSLSFDEAAISVAAGDYEGARVLLEPLLEKRPDMNQAWALLIWTLVRQNDSTGLGDCIKRMTAVPGGSVGGYALELAKGHLAMMQKDLNAARSHFERSLSLNPNSAHLLELLLRLDLMQMRPDAAVVNVHKLLTVDPDNAFGNYLCGSLQVKNGEYDLAEDSYRKSLKKETSAEAMNDLAWILQMRGAYGDAEKMARDVIRMNGKMHQAWDTLGVILMKTRRLDEAEKALDTALALSQEDMSLFVHMAELQAMKGNQKRALEIVGKALVRPEALSPQDRDKAREIRSRMEKLSNQRGKG